MRDVIIRSAKKRDINTQIAAGPVEVYTVDERTVVRFESEKYFFQAVITDEVLDQMIDTRNKRGAGR